MPVAFFTLRTYCEGLLLMKKHIFTLILLLPCTTLLAQATFKAGWNTYNTGTITHLYTYAYTYKDSIKLSLTDSAQIIISADSSVVITLTYPYHDKGIYKTINYFSPKKLLVKTEDYKDDNMLEIKEWKYDDKNRKDYSIDDNKANGNIYKKYYEYATDKKNGDQIITETAYFNGRVEFYTKTYIDKKNVKYKEVRLNDNNKDVVHIETFIYNADGKLTERSVFFPEWKVTKKFPEQVDDMKTKCLLVLPVGIPDKMTQATKIPYIKKVFLKNKLVLADKDCPHFEFTFRNFSNCDIVVATTKVNNGKKVILKYKETFSSPPPVQAPVQVKLVPKKTGGK